MSIELDWQIYDDDTPLPETPPTTTPQTRRRRWILALAIAPPVIAIGIAAGLAVFYRVRLDQVARQVHPIARLEAQAVAENDPAVFLALQDPDDDAWRSMQAECFGRLERVGLPEFGWHATDSEPQPGNLTLEPGGAQLDMLHHLSVTHPLPDGPTTISLFVPHFYRETPSGWVRAMPGPEYWGEQRTQSGKRFAMLYWQCDAAWLEPLIPYMDKVLERACAHLSCPPQPIYVVFDHRIESLGQLAEPAHFDASGFVLSLPSPHLLGLPTDACSRNELYRAIATQVVQALLYEASDQQLDLGGPVWQTIMQWELAQAGLAASPVAKATPHTEGTSFWETWQPLSAISLQPQTIQASATRLDPLLPLALSFIEEYCGAGAVARLTLTMPKATLGQAIRAGLETDPATLESAWLSYTRRQACLAAGSICPQFPTSELVLEYAPERERSGIWRARVDVTGQAHFSPVSASGLYPIWSADGKELAYVSVKDFEKPSVQVQVMNADSGKVTTIMDELPGANVGWLRDGRLWVESSDVIHLLQHDTHSTWQVAGTQQVWSPDGARLAYVVTRLDGTPMIYILDVTSHATQVVASGLEPVWSPDGTRLAFWSGVTINNPHPVSRMLNSAQIQIADVMSHSVWTLVHCDDLLYNIHQQNVKVGDIAWSPDGTFLAATMGWPGSSFGLFVFDADSGAIKVHLPSNQAAPCNECEWTSLEPEQAWSPDSRYVAAWATSSNAWFGESGHVLILDMQTGKQLALPGIGIWVWHPTGHWLAVPQSPNGILLVSPDLAGMHWLDTPQCSSLAWRPIQ